MSNTSRFKWIENFADNEWYLIDTERSNMIIFEIIHFITKTWRHASEEKNIMANVVDDEWEVREYVPRQGKLQNEDLTFYQDFDQDKATSFVHAKNIVNRRMKNMFGKRWKEE